MKLSFLALACVLGLVAYTSALPRGLIIKGDEIVSDESVVKGPKKQKGTTETDLFDPLDPIFEGDSEEIFKPVTNVKPSKKQKKRPVLVKDLEIREDGLFFKDQKPKESENVIYTIVNGRLVPKNKKVSKKMSDKKIKQREAFKKAISDLLDQYFRGIGKLQTKVTPVFGAVVEQKKGPKSTAAFVAPLEGTSLIDPNVDIQDDINEGGSFLIERKPRQGSNPVPPGNDPVGLVEPEEFGGLGEPEEFDGFGEPEEFGGFGEPEEFGQFGEPEEFGQFGESEEFDGELEEEIF